MNSQKLRRRRPSAAAPGLARTTSPLAEPRNVLAFKRRGAPHLYHLRRPAPIRRLKTLSDGPYTGLWDSLRPDDSMQRYTISPVNVLSQTSAFGVKRLTRDSTMMRSLCVALGPSVRLIASNTSGRIGISTCSIPGSCSRVIASSQSEPTVSTSPACIFRTISLVTGKTGNIYRHSDWRCQMVRLCFPSSLSAISV